MAKTSTKTKPTNTSSKQTQEAERSFNRSPIIRNYYTSDLTHPGTQCPGESYVKQAFKEECDINNIMARFQQTGTLPFLNNQQPNYGLAPAIDFKEAMDIVTGSLDSFQQLPAAVREKFGHDPEMFLRFVEDPSNIHEMAEMGLLTPEATQRELEPEKSPVTASEAVSDENPLHTPPADLPTE